MSRNRYFLAAGMLLALGVAGCHKPAPAPAVDADPRAVRVVRVEPRQLAGALSATGPLIPREEAAVSPEVNGYRVARVLVEEGAFVRKGQVLAQLDDTLIRAQIDQQTALANQAAVQAEQAEAQAARVKGLDDQGVLSQEQIDQRRFQARAARATADAQAAALRDLRTRAGKLAVTAPVSGLVLARTVRPGDLAAGGATPWFRLARDGQVELQAQLSEGDISRVRPGQPVRVELANDSVVQGTVRLVDPSIDPQTRLGSMRVSLPVRPDIRAGGFARATFAGAMTDVPAVPESAIRYDADGSSVMVVGRGNRVTQAPIKVGARAGGYAELISGPPVGSVILQKAASLVLSGDVVRPVTAQPARTPPAKAPVRP
jgi:HlyD family secretion protein